MNPERYRRIKKIFNQAVELSGAERASFLALSGESETLIAEIEKMLIFAGDEADENEVLERHAFEIFANGSYAKMPQKIGEYKILREIGRGGMGAVYEAVRETDNFKQRVALKVIKRGMDTEAILSRFRQEQQILSSLEHPFIARFLDGGMTADNLPFYAMEYVEGQFVDDYCREKKTSVNEKLILFRQICSAVQYAHQNLVIHRDLKPSNILVMTDGTPKLLDFGIGKILTPGADAEIGTATQFGMMTPAYASPEQIRGERIGTTSDIYSLGVILYELLAGQKPYQVSSKSPLEIERVVCEKEPRKPSAMVNEKFKAGSRKPEVRNRKLGIGKQNSEDESWESEIDNRKLEIEDRVGQTQDEKSQIKNQKLLRGDLDNIILKSLRKVPAERYSSAGQFSEDLRRYLAGLPVSARPHTFIYRATKFVRRNRTGVIATALIFLSLCAGMTVAAWQAYVARQEKLRAEKRFSEVRQLANNVVFKYHDAIADLPGSTAAREMLVKDALQYLDNLAAESDDNPGLEIELAAAYQKLGDVQGKQYEANLGDTAGAAESYKKSISLLEAVVANDDKNTQAKFGLMKSYDALFANYMRNSDSSDKYEILEKALRLGDRIIAAEPENQEFQMQKVQMLLRKGDSEKKIQSSLEAFQIILPLAESLYQNDPGNLEKQILSAKIYQRIGTAEVRLGDAAAGKGENPQTFYAQALPFHEKSKAFAEKVYLANKQNLPNLRRYAVSLINSAETLAKNGRRDEALMDEALRLMQQVSAGDARNLEAKFDVAEIYRTRAEIRQMLGDGKAAAEELEEASLIMENVYQSDRQNNEARNMLLAVQTKLVDIYQKNGNAEKAARYRRKLEDLQKSAN